jgi:hypothetical protein
LESSKSFFVARDRKTAGFAGGCRPVRFVVWSSQNMSKSFNVWRVLAVTTAIVAVASGLMWYTGFFGSSGHYRPANSIVVLMPYRHAGTWVFDDPTLGLRKEPFVAGIPEMIDEMVKDIPDADNGFRLLFSAKPFPAYTHKLTWRRGDNAGNWYYCEELDKEGWLCPALLKYYREAPREIYAKAEKK